MKNTIEPLFFTVCDPIEEGLETRITIEPGEDSVILNGLTIDYQQLAELSVLLFAIAAPHRPDLDSCHELLYGAEIPLPVKALQELVQIEEER